MASAVAAIVEDDPAIVELLRNLLSSAGFAVEAVGDGEAAIELVKQMHVDVIVLDFELPGINGQETCKRIREITDSYIVMLTARDAEVDKVMSLSSGADDYMTKPFSPTEFVTRIQVLMRRPRATKQADDTRVIRIAEEERRIYVRDNPVSVTPTEFALAQALAAHSPEPVSRVDLAQTVWGRRTGLHVLDVHLSNLRRKLRNAGADPNCIQTERDAALRLRSN